MVKPPKTEEQYKSAIFTIYSKYGEEQSVDRRQVYFGQLCDSVFRWCTGYLFPDAGEMGVEIFNVVRRIITKTLEEEKEFFKYLITALYNAKKEYYRNNKSNIIRLSRTARNKYAEMIDKMVSSLTSYDGEEKDIPNSDYEPESTFFSKINEAVIREAVESVLLSKQERTRECYRALFTAYCIDKSIDFEGADSVLNTEILAAYQKDGKKPGQYEIYRIYHPEVKKDSAGVRASETLKSFLNDLQAALKEKI